TQFFYDAGGRLTTLQDPVGLQTLFSYTGNRVTGITDPAQRTTILQYDAAGNLAAVIDPDMSQRQWHYDGNHRMTLEIDKRGNTDQAFYDFAGRADHSLRADGSVVQVAPVAVQGLFPADQTADRDNAPLAVAPSEAGIEIADPNGHITRPTLDQRGPVLSTPDENGPQGPAGRDANGFVVQKTNALGNQTAYTYDAKGNLTSMHDSFSGPFVEKDLFVGVSFEGPQIAGPPIGDVNGDGAPDIVAVKRDGTGEGFFNTSTAAGKPTGHFSVGQFLTLG